MFILFLMLNVKYVYFDFHIMISTWILWFLPGYYDFYLDITISTWLFWFYDITIFVTICYFTLLSWRFGSLLHNLSFDFQMVRDVKRGAKTHSPAVWFFWIFKNCLKINNFGEFIFIFQNNSKISKKWQLDCALLLLFLHL